MKITIQNQNFYLRLIGLGSHAPIIVYKLLHG